MPDLVSVALREDGVALVRLDDPGAKLNTLSRPAVDELDAAFERLASEPGLQGAVLAGKRGGGLGAGANIGELQSFSTAELRALIDAGHRLLNRLEDFPRPVVASIGSLALGGILELALGPAARVADAGAQVGFPEINLLLFPGLFGGVRTARRVGLDQAIGLVLGGKSLSAEAALDAGLIDEMVPPGADSIEAAARLALDLGSGRRKRRPDLSFSREEVEAAAAAHRPALEKSTRGRGRPRAGFRFLETLPRTLTLPRAEAQALEAEVFCELTSSREGKAGMRHFFVSTAAARPPKALAEAKARPVRRVGVAGVDGYMGNAIAFLALANARLEVVGWTMEFVPNLPISAAERLSAARASLLAKYGPLVKKGVLTQAAAEEAAGRVRFTTDIEELGSCDFVIEAIAENPEIKLAFFEALAGRVRPETVVASNSSSMGPGFLAQAFEKGGGDPASFLNLHFFSPAELPALALVELVAGERSAKDALLTAFQLARSMKKTPILLRDGSRGFLVNAILAAYMGAAESLLVEGTPVERLDAALTAAGMPQGYATLLDAVGLDTTAGMLRFIGQDRSVVYRLVEMGRLGRKSGGGFYDYDGTGPRAAVKGVFPGLRDLLPPGRAAPAEEIVERCFRAMFDRAQDLLERGIVESKEAADLAMVLGLGFPVDLGGIFFYGEGLGWGR
jgi:3-hydroxyacyl-CoA dehydrogenase / enoyl-CoA hydratase / 3-hydroxybutyryl-CoA epimerase / enoyl-CoA isomerase